MSEAGLKLDDVIRGLRAFEPLTLESVCEQLGLENLAIVGPRGQLAEREAQRLGRVMRVLERARVVHRGNREAAIWCLQELPALGRQTPIQKCQTEEGYQRVLHLLGQIEHGIFG